VYRTIEAVTSEEGVQMAREQRPSLILVDIQLPGSGGIEPLGSFHRIHREEQR
jgi:CheY-like chemotaxis protein